MKSSTKILIGVIVVALIGAGVYFGNTGLQKGSIQRIPISVQKTVESVSTQMDPVIEQSLPCSSKVVVFSSGYYAQSPNYGAGIYKDINSFFNLVKNELNKKITKTCSYRITFKKAGESVNNEHSVKCNISDLSIIDSQAMQMSCTQKMPGLDIDFWLQAPALPSAIPYAIIDYIYGNYIAESKFEGNEIFIEQY